MSICAVVGVGAAGFGAVLGAVEGGEGRAAARRAVVGAQAMRQE